MASHNNATIEPGNALDALLAAALGVETAYLDLALGGKKRHEHDSDSKRFQRYETSRKQSNKRNARRIVIDGFIRYADKPYNPARPRPTSPELLRFYRDMAEEETKRKKERI